MRRLSYFWLTLLGAAASCRHAYPVRAASPCNAEAGAGCLDRSGQPGALIVRNLSQLNLCHAHFRPSSVDDWSEPVDDATAIPAGQALDYQLKPALWDVKLSDCKGAVVVERLRLSLAEAGAVLTIP